MPTAYTAILGEREDMTLKDFALLCTRNFGVSIAMRDTPLTVPVPEKFEVDKSYKYKEEYDKAVKEYDDFMALSDSDKVAYLERTYSEMLERERGYAEKQVKEIDVLRRRYNKMLNKVLKWTAPTPDHENLRSFMIEQIRDSIEFDCKEYKPILPSKKDWCDIDRHKAALAKDVAFYKERYESHVEAIAEKNKWLRSLRESLKDCD